MIKTTDKYQNESNDIQFFPFLDAEEAWFWFIQAQQAKNEGARYTAGMSLTPRPCEPADIIKILDRLYRNRLLLRDHLLVLRHYRRRQLRPDVRRDKEAIAYELWCEAMSKIEPVLIRKNIVAKPQRRNNGNKQKILTKELNQFPNSLSKNNMEAYS